MKALLKIIGLLTLVFVCIFLLLNVTGLITIDRIEGWLQVAKSANPWLVGVLVAALLLVDLVIAVPTMATLMLAGYFIGAGPGALAGIIGLMAAGLTGYALSRRYGEKAVALIVKDETERAKASHVFLKHGPVVIVLARAMPMLPEVCACMAGVTRMPLGKFIALWTLNVVPYCAITAYAGSRSTLDDPTPAIFTAIGIFAIFWLGWALFNRRQKRKAP